MRGGGRGEWRLYIEEDRQQGRQESCLSPRDGGSAWRPVSGGRGVSLSPLFFFFEEIFSFCFERQNKIEMSVHDITLSCLRWLSTAGDAAGEVRSWCAEKIKMPGEEKNKRS